MPRKATKKSSKKISKKQDEHIAGVGEKEQRKYVGNLPSSIVTSGKPQCE